MAVLPTRLGLVVVVVILAACGTSATPASPGPTSTPVIASPSVVAPTGTPVLSPDGALTLRTSPPNVGCDAMTPPYRRATFRIDATAAEQVIAVADTGAQLLTYWSEGFVGSAADAVVRDPAGKVVVTDGQVLDIAAGGWPRLAGYFVCPSRDALYILLADPE